LYLYEGFISQILQKKKGEETGGKTRYGITDSRFLAMKKKKKKEKGILRKPKNGDFWEGVLRKEC